MLIWPVGFALGAAVVFDPVGALVAFGRLVALAEEVAFAAVGAFVGLAEVFGLLDPAAVAVG
ncbi:hypothetical protein JOE57_001442 [Microlunatus panaciterrae]|uniref:Uncharacterized protein n=1 Tax=Microlunatus panaciterrae TaxID=400768 RepID=A0ABS2RHN5_9ACTN|nr:hypothetical protein [Microlunatus panaciterrae]MBM7798521.1 hypothetical protein [Microlunatus panaciterrae]